MNKPKLKNNLLRVWMIIAILVSSSVAITPAQAQSGNPPDLAVITPENVTSLKFLTRMGQGVLTGEFDLQPKGNLIAAATASGVALYDRVSGKQAGFVDLGFQATAVSISPDSQTLAAVYNVPTGEMVKSVLDGNESPEYLTQIGLFSLPDGKSKGTPISDLKECGQSNIWQIAFTPDGKELVFEKKYGLTNKEERFCALSVQNGKITRTLDIPDNAESTLSPNGEYAAIVQLDGNNQASKAIIYETKDLKTLIEIDFSPTNWPEIAFTRNGDYFTVRYYDGEAEKVPQTVQFWSLPDGKPAFSILYQERYASNPTIGQNEERYDHIMALDVSSDNRWAAIGTQNGKIELWDIQAGKIGKELGTLTWTGSNQVANAGGALSAEINSYVNPMEFSADGKTLVAAEYRTTGGQVGQIHVYQMPGGEETAAFYGATVGDTPVSFAFSPDSRQIAYGGFADGSVEIRNTSDGSLALRLSGHSAMVNQAKFSPDGKVIATASDDNTLRLWDAKTGETLKVLKGHTQRVNQIAFSADGAWLFSGADDNTIRRWKTADGGLVDTRQLGNENWRVEFLTTLPDSQSVVYHITKYPSPLVGFMSKQILWDTKSGKETPIGNGELFITALSSDGKTFTGYTYTDGKRVIGALAADGTMTIMASVRSPYGNGALVNPILSPDNRLLISGNGFGTHAWKTGSDSAAFIGLIAQGEPVPVYGQQYVLSPDGKILAVADGGVVYLLGVPAS
jgi:WD40 repeat protein